MSLQSRNVPVEEVQRVQKSLWRQSSAVKDAIRDAAGRVLEHVRSRETFLLEQVGIKLTQFVRLLTRFCSITTASKSFFEFLHCASTTNHYKSLYALYR